MSFSQLTNLAPVPAHDARRQRLQTATRAAHRRVDDAIFVLMKRGRAGYAHYLVASLATRRELEAQALAAGSPVAGFLESIELELALDLEEVTGAPAGVRAEAQDPVATVPPDTAGLWGTAYVLAGSCLGAAHLMHHVATLDWSRGVGMRHLARQRKATCHWLHFLDALEALSFTPAEEAACVSAAVSAFSAFEVALEEPERT